MEILRKYLGFCIPLSKKEHFYFSTPSMLIKGSMFSDPHRLVSEWSRPRSTRRDLALDGGHMGPLLFGREALRTSARFLRCLPMNVLLAILYAQGLMT